MTPTIRLLGAIAVQLSIGGIYAWSVFARALTADSAMGLSTLEASLPFQVAIGLIFVGAFAGGRWQDRQGPRRVALSGVVLYSAGVMLASLARSHEDLWLLVLGYGVLGGLGLGLAYIVPIAMLQKWFPERSALVTGAAVAGFGFGAVITSPVAQWLIDTRPEAPAAAFLPIGAAYLLIGGLGAATFANPRVAGSVSTMAGWDLARALRSPQWYLLTLTLTLSVFAGISLISIAAAAMVEIPSMSAVAAAAAVGVLGLFNGGGRLAWAAISQRLGQTVSLALILALQGVALLILPHASSPWLFLLLAAVIYTCYGGAFGTLPSTAGAFFGVAHAGAIYGLMLIGWSLGGVVGPMVVALLVADHQRWLLAFTTVGIVALLSAVVPLLARRPVQDIRG